jgi:hypothetical protein
MNAVVGVGISVAFFFLRYAVPVMPKSVAWVGVVAGAWIVLADLLGMKLGIAAIVLYVVGAVCIGGALHLTFGGGNRSETASASSGNTIGEVRGNRGIITQGQTGDNKVGK